jgi:arylsulfatase A-like enzyme
MMRFNIKSAHRPRGHGRVLFGLAAAGTILLALGSTPLATPAEKKPNILFILADDLRWDALGCYGNDVVKTPNLDRLAREGARLDALYVAAPMCTPSRAAFLSGLYPHQSGILDDLGKTDLDPGTPTIATYLNDAGYATGFVGKAHMGGDPRRWGFKDTPVWLPKGSAQHRDPMLVVRGITQRVPGHITQIFTDSAIKFIEAHRADRWFLWLATTAPHTPYYEDPRFTYEAEAIKPPPGWPKGERFTATSWTGYYSTITMLDEQIGRVLRRLDELGLAQNTFVLVSADNGLLFGSHGHSGKQAWFEGSARVPGVARWPGNIPAGTTVSSLLSSVDFLPTALDLAGRETPKGLEGVSMLPALTKGQPVRTVAYSAAHRRAGRGGGYWRMVRTDRWKYVNVQYITSRHRGERLYDLRDDPSEVNDLSKSKDHAEVLERARRQLQTWLEATPPAPTSRRGPPPR